MKLTVSSLLLCCVTAGAKLVIRPKVVAPVVDPSSWGAVDLIDSMNMDLARVTRSLSKARSFLQISDAPAKASANTSKKVPVAPAALKKKNFDVEAAEAQMANLGPAQMPAMLGLLKGMYGSWKEKIGTANKREKAEKKDFDAEIEELELKKKKFQGDANATECYDKIEKYWKRQREIAHRQYHTVLKIAHSGMEKFKTVMGAMTNAIDGKKISQATAQKIGLEMPEVVLIQQFQTLTRWVKGASSLLRDAK